jgi:hypothetical protein
MEQIPREAGECARLEAENARLRAELERIEALRAGGFLFQFEYPYTPKVRDWGNRPESGACGRLIATGMPRYQSLLPSFLAYNDAFTAIGVGEPSDERQPFWGNPWLPALDAICLSGLVTKLNPKRYVEVGSGNSTKFVRRAITDHKLRTRIISIDPHPRAIIDELCDEVVRERLEDCDLGLFGELGADDVLFIDNSHRCFQNSDVTVVFTEVIPSLGVGCHYGIHDIFLPFDYPHAWLERYYNEQYVLMAYLLGGAGGDEIVLPVHYIERTSALVSILDPITTNSALNGTSARGGAFWMRAGERR